jgi:hypothetical protein
MAACCNEAARLEDWPRFQQQRPSTSISYIRYTAAGTARFKSAGSTPLGATVIVSPRRVANESQATAMWLLGSDSNSMTHPSHIAGCGVTSSTKEAFAERRRGLGDSPSRFFSLT